MHFPYLLPPLKGLQLLCSHQVKLETEGVLTRVSYLVGRAPDCCLCDGGGLNSGSGGEDEAPGRSLFLQVIHHLLERLPCPHLGPIIKVPGAYLQARDLRLDLVDYWVEQQPEEEGCNRITLVVTMLTGNGGGPKL